VIELRRMQESDVLGVMEIEIEVTPAPWSYGIFSDCIKVGYSCFVFEENSEILGYGLFSLGVDDAHILNLAIKPTHQRQGLGRWMLEHLLAEIKLVGKKTAYLEVRLSNTHASDLYQKMGFEQIGYRKDYYQTINGREDALIFAYTFS